MVCIKIFRIKKLGGNELRRRRRELKKKKKKLVAERISAVFCPSLFYAQELYLQWHLRWILSDQRRKLVAGLV